jgi:hypothetical protein
MQVFEGEKWFFHTHEAGKWTSWMQKQYDPQ